jgi:ubiquitin thioesterase OTU1
MRDIIAAAVSSDEKKYSEPILGKPNEDYCAWIRKDDSWGGAIEAQILSEYLGTVVTVVDTQSDYVSNFGEELSFGQRIFLIYDGIHYDPLFRYYQMWRG